MRPFGWVALEFSSSHTMVGCLCGGCSPLKTPPREILGLPLWFWWNTTSCSVGPLGAEQVLSYYVYCWLESVPERRCCWSRVMILGARVGGTPGTFPRQYRVEVIFFCSPIQYPFLFAPLPWMGTWHSYI